MPSNQISDPSNTSGGLEPKKRKKGKKTALWILVILLGALAGVGYTYRTFLMECAPQLLALLGMKQEAGHKDVYYCPMHPTYHSDKPGTCPICNMNLLKMEPEKSTEAGEAAKEEAGAKPGKRKILYWTDAMNPSFRSDKPGKAPDGMDLVPVYAEEGPATEGLPSGTVKVTPQKQQLIGVQYGEVHEQALSKTIRTVGQLTYDTTRIARVTTKVMGWIDHVYVDFTGKLVKKGQPLVSVYSPDLVSAQQELIIARKAKDSLGTSPFADIGAGAASLYESTRERLRLWDITDAQIREIEKRGTPSRALTLYSPVSGFVTTRNAYTGQRISPDTEIYDIADLSNIWVLADIYEYEVPMIQLGQTAAVTLSYFPGKVFTGKLTYIYPDLDQKSRTLKVRIEFPNPEFKLKPDMFANVEIKIDYGRKLAVPHDAVLDSGSEQIVFLAREDGYFEPRKVTLGQQVGGQVIVLEGLKAGDRVVTSANFLIDSESQLKSALGGMSESPHAGHGGAAPAGGAEKDSQKEKPGPAAPADHSQHGGMPQSDHSAHK